MMRSYISSHLIKPIGRYNLTKVNREIIHHIRATGDIVSKGTGQHIGRKSEIYVDHWGDEKFWVHQGISNSTQLKIWCRQWKAFEQDGIMKSR